MPVTIVIGAQWGDEGKGKLVDRMAATADVVARYQGGANAGHTIEWGAGEGKRKAVLHLVPSGIFHAGTTCVVGGGVVLDPVALLDEVAMVEAMGFEVAGRLFVSHTAHVIMPWHKRLDAAREQAAADAAADAEGRGEGGTTGAIGTTGRGIGPAYIDKVARTGIRVVDLLDRDRLAAQIRALVAEKNEVLAAIYGAERLDVEAIVEEYVELDRRLDPYVKDTSAYLHDVLQRGGRVVAEGAQGALLDVDFGTYPYVTSSSPTAGGAMTGLGIPPTAVDRIVGIAKAYSTRVGNGPFVTEMHGADGEALRAGGPRVRRHDGPPAPLRLARPRRPRLLGAHQRPHRDRAHQARRAQRHGHAPRLHRLPHRRARDDALPRRRADAGARRAGLRDVRRMARGPDRHPPHRRPPGGCAPLRGLRGRARRRAHRQRLDGSRPRRNPRRRVTRRASRSMRRARVTRTLAIAWAAPNTALGLALVALARATGGEASVVGGVVEASGGVVGRVLGRGGIAAMTLGHVVVARDAPSLVRTRAHERVHVRQYARWGPFFLPAYAAASLWAALRGRRAYRDNAFEVAAYDEAP